MFNMFPTNDVNLNGKLFGVFLIIILTCWFTALGITVNCFHTYGFSPIVLIPAAFLVALVFAGVKLIAAFIRG